MKTCTRCARTLDLSEFNFKSRSTGLRQVYCRECSRRYVREHYSRKVQYYRAKARARNALVRADTQKRLLDYLRGHPYVDCGESDPVVLQFDHEDPASKFLEVALLFRRGFSWGTIEREIGKCCVRCANCHQRRTARQFGWYRVVGGAKEVHAAMR